MEVGFGSVGSEGVGGFVFPESGVGFDLVGLEGIESSGLVFLDWREDKSFWFYGYFVSVVGFRCHLVEFA